MHADLSEYNILYFEVSIALDTLKVVLIVYIYGSMQCYYSSWQGHLYIIDVSQAVEPDHVHANEFLCRDCVHVSVSFTEGTGFSFVIHVKT